MNQCILLTACVNPGKMTLTHLKDSSERLNQYKTALDFYLNETDIPIVFCENTNTDFSSEYQQYIKSGRLEYLTFDGNNYDVRKGKGYGEAIIIKYAFNHSRIIKQSSIIIKITGRLVCKNINQLVGKCNKPETIYSSLYADKRGHILADSRVLVAPNLFWVNSFLHLADNINDSNNIFFEHIFYLSSLRGKKQGFSFKEIWFPIEIEGTSGTSGISYTIGFFPKIKFYIHYFLHRLGYYGPLAFWK